MVLVALLPGVLAAAERFFHQRGIMTSTPAANPTVKLASTTSTNGACQNVPKKKFTDTTCWLFSAKANSVKKMAALSSHSTYFNGRTPEWSGHCSDASGLGFCYFK